MEYSIHKLAHLAGVTTRTLRHYHQIGLLLPARVSSSGYRIYGAPQVDRLQQILFYRALGFELGKIGQLLDNPAFSAEAALAGHLAALRDKRAALDTLIATAEKTLKTIKGETTMNDTEKFEGFKQKLVADNETAYGDEIRQKYGDETVNASNAKMMNMTKEQYESFTALGEKLNATLQAAVQTGNPASPEAQQAADLHRQWLTFTWPSYSPEAHLGLAQMYVADERFTAYYESIAPGAANFLHEAIKIYTGNLPE